MSRERLRGQWERLGRTDPLWAVLTRPDKRGNRWDPAEFFATGREEIDSELARLESAGLTVRRGAALDFGCGVGRLTQALARHFDRVCGVDVSSSMIEKARELNRFPETCTFVHNSSSALEGFDDASFDFAVSHLVLQHIPPHLAFGYIRELLRILAPGGVLLFGLPSVPRATAAGLVMKVVPAPLLNVVRRASFGFEMHGTKRPRVEARLAAMGGTVVNCREDETGHWVYCVYTVVRSGPDSAGPA